MRKVIVVLLVAGLLGMVLPSCTSAKKPAAPPTCTGTATNTGTGTGTGT